MNNEKCLNNDNGTGIPKLQHSYFHNKNHVHQLRKTMGIVDEEEIISKLNRK